MGGASGGASSKWKEAARKIFLPTCGSFCHRQQLNQTHVLDHTASYDLKKKISSETEPHQSDSSSTQPSNKNLCTICLEPLNYVSNTSPGQAIFTAQCSHAFHFSCISSNVRHGSVTCPICRAHWTQLPRNLSPRCPLNPNKIDPVLQILDDSIANSRFHRRSFLRSARYDDDDPVDPSLSCSDLPTRLNFSLSSLSYRCGEPKINCPRQDSDDSDSDSDSNHQTYLNVKLSNRPPIDLVLVASPNGPHLRLMKQAMALAVFSLEPTDRLAIVTYSSSASRVFPLRRMTSYGKRAALQVIDRLFYAGHADPVEGLKKGVKIIEDSLHKNPRSSILHLTDNPSRSYYRQFDLEVPVSIRRFDVSYGFGSSSGFVMREFEDVLVRTIGGAVKNVQVTVGGGSRVFGIGELRGGEERNVPLGLDGRGPVCVGYSYVDDGDEGCVRTGEAVVGFEETGEDVRSGDEVDSVSVSSTTGARMSLAETWEYHDTFMARRWAKRLNGYRI